MTRDEMRQEAARLLADLTPDPDVPGRGLALCGFTCTRLRNLLYAVGVEAAERQKRPMCPQCGAGTEPYAPDWCHRCNEAVATPEATRARSSLEARVCSRSKAVRGLLREWAEEDAKLSAVAPVVAPRVEIGDTMARVLWDAAEAVRTDEVHTYTRLGEEFAYAVKVRHLMEAAFATADALDGKDGPDGR